MYNINHQMNKHYQLKLMLILVIFCRLLHCVLLAVA